MHLKRVQVPDFRVLKNVDISFEDNFSPRIFPLGSQNGGGKSTLLQLIFLLLHCAFTPNRLFAVKNTLSSFSLGNTARRTLAIISVTYENQEVELEFFSCADSYIDEFIAEDLGKEEESEIYIPDNLKFSELSKTDQIKQNLSRLVNEQVELEEILSELEDISTSKQSEVEKRFYLERLLTRSSHLIDTNQYRPSGKNETSLVRLLLSDVARRLDRVKVSQKRLNSELSALSFRADRITEYLDTKKIVFVCNYSSATDNDEQQAFMCQVRNLELGEVGSFLSRLSSKIFLAAPSSQVFIFLGKEINRLLFKQQAEKPNSANYYSRLRDIKSILPGLFTYDFLEVDILVDAFKSARDKDFQEALETGTYGNSYQALLKDLRLVLANKQINLRSNLTELTFRTLSNDVEFYPEDLSHGELKRLSIYMWLKYRNIEDAIVLMDEIEIALHPDWQYGIVSDLLQWSPTNQYILATHSYELCQALTPAHVKELEPKLLKQTEQQV